MDILLKQEKGLSPMARKSTKRGSQPWDTTDKAFMGLYGISLEKPEASKPRFGSSFRPVLTVGGETMLHAPTPSNLAAHLGYMDWMDSIIKKLTQVKLPPDQFQQLVAMCRKGSRDLLKPRIEKLRRALLSFPQSLYLYCVSEIKTETDMVTGKPFSTEGERVLCILPKTPQVAQHYGLSESEIALLAPQVMWLVTVLLPGQHIIYTQAQLVQAMDGWPVYLLPATREQLLAWMRRTHPQLVSAQATQLLLPGA